MSELRKAMNDQMLLKGFSESTKRSYLAVVSLLARHYHLPPDKLSHEDIQNWFLYLIKEHHITPATCRAYLHALRFFYHQVLHWKNINTGFLIPKKNSKYLICYHHQMFILSLKMQPHLNTVPPLLFVIPADCACLKSLH